MTNIDKKVDDFEAMWKRVEAEAEKINPTLRPKNSFTSREFAERRKVDKSNANRLLKKLLATGKIKRVGTQSTGYYYMLVEEG